MTIVMSKKTKMRDNRVTRIVNYDQSLNITSISSNNKLQI